MISLSNFCGQFSIYTCIYLSMCPLKEMGASHCSEKIRRIQLQEFALPGTILNCGLPEYPHEHSFYTKFCGTFLTQACIYLCVCALGRYGNIQPFRKSSPTRNRRIITGLRCPLRPRESSYKNWHYQAQ